MKNIGIAGTVLAVACAVGVGSGADAADVYQPTALPTVPGCTAGYSWQKAGVRYQCMTPPPTCQYGFISAPVWNGSSWNYACALPPPPPPPPPDPDAACITAAPTYGFQVTRGPTRVYAAGTTGCLGMACRLYDGQGPRAVVTSCGDTTTVYILYCYMNPDNSVNRVTGAPQPVNITCGGEGG